MVWLCFNWTNGMVVKRDVESVKVRNFFFFFFVDAMKLTKWTSYTTFSDEGGLWYKPSKRKKIFTFCLPKYFNLRDVRNNRSPVSMPSFWHTHSIIRFILISKSVELSITSKYGCPTHAAADFWSNSWAKATSSDRHACSWLRKN